MASLRVAAVCLAVLATIALVTAQDIEYTQAAMDDQITNLPGTQPPQVNLSSPWLIHLLLSHPNRYQQCSIPSICRLFECRCQGQS
jgi:hypothetical protein